MLHYAYKETDRPGTYLRILLCDFSKAFDLVDHQKLIAKLQQLGVPEHLVKWSASFLSQREQRVKIGNNISDVVTPNAGCPQGTLIGPLAFVCHINDLAIPDPVKTIKYVDDTSMMLSCTDPNDPHMQRAADVLSQWSLDNHMKLNAKKTKELVVNFSKQLNQCPPIIINNTTIERVLSSKVLGVIISHDLTWNKHVDYITNKATKRIYMLVRCKRAGVTRKDLRGIYCAIIRPILEYCCVVWHTTLPKYLHDQLESIQRRVTRLFCGHEMSYSERLHELNLKTLHDRREEICISFYNSMCNPSHRLFHLLPPPSTRRRSQRTALNVTRDPPRCRTNRYKNSFVPYALYNFQGLSKM